VLKYDRVVRPHELHALKPAPETRSAPSGSESETSHRSSAAPAPAPPLLPTSVFSRRRCHQRRPAGA
jgi:hypothetical protein